MKLTENFYVYSIVFYAKTQYLVFRNQKRHYMQGYQEKPKDDRGRKKMEQTTQNTEKTEKKEVKPEEKKPAIAPGQMRVIKRNGSVVSYN